MEKSKKGKKCKALLRNCRTILPSSNEACMYHFKNKKELICPQCGEPRQVCGNWALKGKDYCRYHGGVGRPVKDINKVIFTSEEQEEIARAESIRLRHAENIYQKAFILLKKVLNNINPEDDGADAAALKAVSDYFKNIEKPMSELKLEGIQGEHIQHIKFNELDEKQLNELKRESFITGCMTTANCFLKVLMTAVPEKDRRVKIVNELPDVVRQFAKENFKELE